MEERERVRTSNHPRAVLWPELIAHIEALIARRPVHTPVRGTRAWSRRDSPRTVEPGDLLIVEGHLIFCNEMLRNLMEIKIFLDADPHERVLRRMVRDTAGGGTDLEKAVAWYRRDVIPNFSVHTEPTRRYADLIVPFDSFNDTAIQFIASGVRETLTGRTEKGNGGIARDA